MDLPISSRMNYQDIIIRITVADVLSYLAAGMSIEEILEDFPKLKKEDVYASLAYAAAAQRHTTI
jgi:uncharacterized protein (DUF433 family)